MTFQSNVWVGGELFASVILFLKRVSHEKATFQSNVRVGGELFTSVILCLKGVSFFFKVWWPYATLFAFYFSLYNTVDTFIHSSFINIR